MNDQVFNTPFEFALRIILLLAVNPQDSLTVDELATADFLTTFSKEFGLSSANLHGDNNYCYTEYSARRQLIQEAVKNLATDRYIVVGSDKSGFAYKISAAGSSYRQRLTSEYSKEYSTQAAIVISYLKTKSKEEIMNLISITARQALNRR